MAAQNANPADRVMAAQNANPADRVMAAQNANPADRVMAAKGKRAILIEEFEHGKTESEVVSTDGVNVLKHGYSKTWLKNRLVRHENYNMDRLDGLQTKYYINGDLYKTVEWVAGVKHGKVVINAPDGSRTEYTNVNGEISGPKYSWDGAGNLIETIEYD
ncbi:hypothetical protein F-LCD7_0480 [Faustovirus]|nr:hypothetical protein F-LCD7_0480 [Faustovirus]QJX73238.1 hypothetical protein F-VV57_0477 [Faustovirus]QJX73745.1 hypothetical protein F-VV63_0479 [Faustovirus]